MCYISCASFGGILSWQKYWHPIFPTMWVTWVLPRPTGNRKMSSPLTLPWQVTNFALWTYNFVKARSNILFIFPYSKFWPVHFISSDFSVLPFWHSFWHLCSHSFWHSFLAFIPFFSLKWALPDLNRERQWFWDLQHAFPQLAEKQCGKFGVLQFSCYLCFFCCSPVCFLERQFAFFFVFTSSPVWFLEQPVVFFYGHQCAFVSAHFSREEKAE